MATFLLPKGWCEKIDRLLKDFRWGFPANKSRNFTPWAWDLIFLPKDWGGPGIRRTFEVNTPLITKLASFILTNTYSLWVQILKAKYFSNSSFLEANQCANTSSVERHNEDQIYGWGYSLIMVLMLTSIGTLGFQRIQVGGQYGGKEWITTISRLYLI